MPVRPPACARAVQRQLLKPPDSAYLLDDVSGNPFRRFASSVPGPLESRRRLGKRRLTQQSDNFTPTYSGAFWDLFPGAGVFKWEWQAPTNRAEKQGDASSLLSSWLLGLGNAPLEEDTILGVDVDEIPHPVLIFNDTSVEAGIQRLRESTRSASHPRELHSTLEPFLPLIKQNIALGLLSGDMLSSVLQEVTTDFRDASARWNISLDKNLFMLYAAIWEGIESCKVMGPMDYEGKTMDSFLSLLACLPLDEMVQDLATKILLATSPSQHLNMEQGTKAVINAWSHTWLAKEHASDCQADLEAAETAILEIERSLAITRDYLITLEEQSISHEGVFQIKANVSKIQRCVSLAERAIKTVDEILCPPNASARKLAVCLDYLPAALLSRTVLSCSDSIALNSSKQENSVSLRYYWLCTVSYSSKVGDQLFLKAWKKIEDPKIPFNDTQYCHIILGHWNSQGLVTRLFNVEALFSSSNVQDLASLLFSFDRSRQNFLQRARNLFLLLEKLGKFHMIYKLLSRLRSLGLKLPITQLRLLIEILSKYDVNLALKAYGLHHGLCIDCKRFSTTFLQRIINTAINDTNINPSQLWRHLQIPIHGSRPLDRGYISPRPLRKQTIDLLNTIATGFARCETRSTRVALRNVLQCLYHLRYNNAPITLELSMAITQTGIAREIRGIRPVAQGRLLYAISIIEEVEGKAAANLVDELVFRWREYLTRELVRRHREKNVLRVGPID